MIGALAVGRIRVAQSTGGREAVPPVAAFMDRCAVVKSRVAPPSGQNRIMIYGPKNDGTYIVEFRTADGEALAISVPASETHVLKHFQERMAYGLFVPDVNAGAT